MVHAEVVAVDGRLIHVAAALAHHVPEPLVHRVANVVDRCPGELRYGSDILTGGEVGLVLAGGEPLQVGVTEVIAAFVNRPPLESPSYRRDSQGGGYQLGKAFDFQPYFRLS